MEPKHLDVKYDCKRIRRMNEVTIMDLPRVIMAEILSRLPIKPIFRCKTVCKLWYHLLTSDPLFVKMYHTKSCNFPCILLSINNSVRLLVELKPYYDYDSQPLNRHIFLSRKFHLPRPSDLLSDDLFGFTSVKENLTLIGSCNGFICLLNGWSHEKNHSVYINNPLLGEYFKVKLPEKEKRVRCVAYAFCYSEEGSGQYKILRSVKVRKFQGRPEVLELDVYTLGVDEKWRNVGEAPCPVSHHFGKVNVNGSLHWMDREKNDSIYSFDIGIEKLKSLPFPPGLKTPSPCLTLVELGNCLCLSDNISFQHIDIWWMKEYGIAESWVKDRISLYHIPPDICDARYVPIIIWKDGKILMQKERGAQLISYNPYDKKFTKVNVYGIGIAATKYVPSLYSLKTVMGDNLQVSNVFPKTE
ncbi:F-box protein At3g07870-like [Lycium ferocissimum]|uniref:F-box protein At3g07870-like n=1 Tax=Lycium ferocissimum TaxID=112874 RepID=UPI0028168FF2|nr:F-box protein At3g07870-like [Lycium ferocissimum]